MQTQAFVSIRTIVILTVAVSTALIAALLIFHLRSEATSSVSTSNEAILFPVGREIKPFDLMSTDIQTFTQKNLNAHWTLLFFGFTHCADVCPATLDMLSHAYRDLSSRYPNLQVVFVSLDPERDTIAALSQYMKTFHPAFIGVSGSLQSLRKLQSQLGIFAIRDTAPQANYQIQHSSSIMLINPQGKWAGMFKYGLSPQKFIEIFEKSIHSLSEA